MFVEAVVERIRDPFPVQAMSKRPRIIESVGRALVRAAFRERDGTVLVLVALKAICAGPAGAGDGVATRQLGIRAVRVGAADGDTQGVAAELSAVALRVDDALSAAPAREIAVGEHRPAVGVGRARRAATKRIGTEGLRFVAVGVGHAPHAGARVRIAEGGGAGAVRAGAAFRGAGALARRAGARRAAVRVRAAAHAPAQHARGGARPAIVVGETIDAPEAVVTQHVAGLALLRASGVARGRAIAKGADVGAAGRERGPEEPREEKEARISLP